MTLADKFLSENEAHGQISKYGNFSRPYNDYF